MVDNYYIQLINETAKNYISDCLELSNYLSDHPEVSGEEKESCLYVVNFLRNKGYDVTTPYVGVPHSFLAVKKRENRPKIALMCEYDALPEIGHGCGHSLSCAISILAALILEKAFPDFPFQVDIIGTPAEEIGGGKILLADNGAFDGYEFAAMAHMSGQNISKLKVLASCDMEVTFHGKSAHASAEPWEGKNALNGVQLFFHALDMMRQHLTPDCQMHGVITNGGIFPSIVPEEATCYLYPRAGSMKNLNKLWDKMENCAKGAAMATETTCEVKMLYNKYGDLYISPTAETMLDEVFEQFGLPYSHQENGLGSTDAGNVDQLIPVFHPMVKIGNDPEIKMHSKEFADLMKSEEAETALLNGGKIVAGICTSMAYGDGYFEKIKAEHKKYRGL